MSLILFILIGFNLLNVHWLLKIRSTDKWIKNNQKKLIKVGDEFPIFILMPVLHEERRIKKTVQYFLKSFKHLSNLKIVIITTEKEYLKIKKGKNTVDIAVNLARENCNVLHFHYLNIGGKMAHQVNYGVSRVSEKYKTKKSFFALYNADSRPDPRTMDWVISDHFKNSKHEVYQQYGNYLSNYNSLGFGIKKSILVSAGSWQNRWSLGFEIAHALKQFKSRIFFKDLGYPLNYCIGHGLFFTSDVFLEVRGFSENTHNEDAIFGLELSYLQKKIHPIPFFDLSDSPDTLKSLFNQKKNWFFGPFQACTYYREICKKRPNINKLKLLILSIKLFSHALYWVIGPSLFVISIMLVATNFTFLWLFLFLLTFTLFLPFFNSLSTILVNESYWNNLKYPIIFNNIMGGFIMYIMHGLSAYASLLVMVSAGIFRKNIEKGKTEMTK